MSQQWITSTIIIILLSVSLSFGEERPLVETSLGKVRGHYQQSYGGRKYVAFEGIPYAKPPIGDLRFEEPIEIEPWTGIWVANIVHTCMQPGWLSSEPMGSEDCLYLNVYVPEDKLDNKSNLDVILHIHGGGFMVGDPNMVGPGYLMDRNVLYVSINYRLSILGFLSTEDDVVPGNMGLKDQVMALRWVQKHIKSFGGNPNSVTIIGASAGAACVHFHYFSSLSRGLFHRGFSQGGTALAPWSIQNAPLKVAKRLAKSIGCDSSSTKEIVQCLKQRSPKQVIQNSYRSPIIDGFPLAPFAPVVEKQSPGAFITDYPYNLLMSGSITDVPWITGATTEEGIVGIFLLKFQYDNLNENWNTLLPHFLNYENTVGESDEVDVAQKIKKFYLNDNKVTEDNVGSLIKLFSDRYFYLSLEKSAEIQASVLKSPVYTYIYGYRDDAKYDEILYNSTKSYGVSHGSDAYFLYTMNIFGNILPKGKLSKSDEKIKEFLLDVVTSFANDGKPISNSITWEPVVNSSEFRYLLITNDEIKMVSTAQFTPIEFWQSLPLKEYDNAT